MFKIGNVVIAPDIVELMPESVARENACLPLRYSEARLHILVADPIGLRDLKSKLEFILNEEVVLEIGERGHVEGMADVLYSMYSARITRCNRKFALNCSRKWLELVESDSLAERHCPDCNETVYHCTLQEEAEQHARMGHCVSLHKPDESEAVDTMGLIEFV